MNLLISYYTSEDESRNQEYLGCLGHNLDNELIEKITVFIQPDCEHPLESDKIEYVISHEEVTYKTFLDYCKNNLKGETCIVANSDILFDDTLSELEQANLDGKILCLTRWNLNKDGTLEFYSPTYGSDTSQDVWIFKGGLDISESDIPLGYMGCDNRIAYEAYKSGIRVCNPSHLIICKHIHNSGHRTTATERVYGEYLFVEPSSSFEEAKTYKTLSSSIDNETGEPKFSRINTLTNFVRRKATEITTAKKTHNVGVLVTGGSGLVGTAIQKYLKDRKTSEFLSSDVVFISSKDYDLRRPEQAASMFDEYKPRNVIHLAGMVGGVQANSQKPAEFYTNNIYINTNIVHFSHKYETSKLLCMLSSCIYPDSVSYPIKESYLHLGPPHESNFGYAQSKRMLEVQMRAYRQQYESNFFGVIPTNIFGENDNFSLGSSHVIPAIIRKVYDAMLSGKSTIRLWGDGTPKRQFSYSGDIAKILVALIENDHQYELINIGDETEKSIKDVAEIICDVFGFTGNILWDDSMPKGQDRKPTDMSRLKESGLYSFSDFRESIESCCDWFEKNYKDAKK